MTLSTKIIRGAVLLALTVTLAAPAASAEEPGPAVGSPAYVARDAKNVLDAYGRITGPGGQLRNPRYLPALNQRIGALAAAQLTAQAANPLRPAITAGRLVPGWSSGNPLRVGWEKTRGELTTVSFTNRYGALLSGTLFAPRAGATHPDSGEPLDGPFPGVVITPGSVQGSQEMYHWLAQDLAERGYVVLTFDVQGQGGSETLPHQTDDDLPFCNPFSTPVEGELSGCPGVPSQQTSNFVFGTEDALDFFTSTPEEPYANPGSTGAKNVAGFNPFWQQFDRTPDPTPATPGRTQRIAIIGHSLGAQAVSKVQGEDERVAAVVALDKLSGSTSFGPPGSGGSGPPNDPVVPALAVQSEYGFTVAPYLLAGGSSITPQPTLDGPDPTRERASGFDDWQADGVDSMLIVPRASTHLEYTDIPLVLPASRYGQDLTSVYTQLWLDRYLKHDDNIEKLLGTEFTYPEPVGEGEWKPVTLDRDSLLSFYFCSAYQLDTPTGARSDGDLTGVGCE